MLAGERYVTLGLASVRAPWFSAVARWATVGSLPVEFVKCMSADEVGARLRTGRAYSALLIDTGAGVLDRDLVHLASSSGCAVIAVGRAHDLAAWTGDEVAVLPVGFTREQLLEALDRHARPIATGEQDALLAETEPIPSGGWRGRLIVVAGGGGSGTSTVAAALAQGLAADARHGGMVLLGDFALQADQAMLHDVGDVVPGLPELVDAHRRGQPSSEEVRALTFESAARGYHLLLGLRRRVDWVNLRARAVEAAVDNVRRAFSVVVADADGDLEGEEQSGSVEVEERNVLARTLAARADLVLLVGTPGVKGLHGLVRLVAEFTRFGVAPNRILAVVNRAPRSPRARAELCRAFADLSVGSTPSVVGPVFLPDRHWLDDIHRDGSRFPNWFTVTLVGAVQMLLDGPTRQTSLSTEPTPVVPGRVGSWTEQDVPAP